MGRAGAVEPFCTPLSRLNQHGNHAQSDCEPSLPSTDPVNSADAAHAIPAAPPPLSREALEV